MQLHHEGPCLQRALLMAPQRKASGISRGLLSEKVLSGRHSRKSVGRCVNLGIEGAGRGLWDALGISVRLERTC